MSDSHGRASRLGELACLFLRLGTTAFGGPAAHVAMLQEEAVHRRGWLSQQEFLDLVSATQLIPGPNSTEMAIHIGYQRAGRWGLVVAGSCFILPAALMISVLAWLYVRYGALPEASTFLYGVKPVMIAVVAQALWKLGKSALKSRGLWLLGLLALLAVSLGMHELLVLLLAGGLWSTPRSGRRLPSLAWVPATAASTPVAFGLLPLFGFFCKVGCVLFGSGYVLLAFLHNDLVERWHWLTNQQLLDAITAGQITPGPVFTTATFIGFVLAGPAGALVATLGIFVPAFVFVALSGPLVPRLRKSPQAAAFLDGLNVASLALMVGVSLQLGRVALVDGFTALLAVLSVGLLVRYRVNSLVLIVAGALLGMAALT